MICMQEILFSLKVSYRDYYAIKSMLAVNKDI